MTDCSPQPASTEQLVRAAQSGDDEARERVIRRHWNFIGTAAGRAAKRRVRTDDDLWSEALIAFNKAIDAYNEQRLASFATFANLVIARRLIDSFRRQARRRDLPLAYFEGIAEEGDTYNPVSDEEARRRAAVMEQGEDLALEVSEYREALRVYGVELDELVDGAPRRSGARKRASQVAHLLVEDPECRRRFTESKKLPLKQLSQMPGCAVSRQTMERNRAFIVAVAAIKLGSFSGIESFAGD